jgi:hypothetical protein
MTTNTATDTPTAPTAHTVGIKAGDYFSGSWGYDQTNIDYYQVVSVSKSGRTVHVVPVSTIILDSLTNGGTNDTVGPGDPTGPKVRKTLRFYDQNRRKPGIDEVVWSADFRTADWAGAPRPSWCGPGAVPISRQTNTLYGH